MFNPTIIKTKDKYELKSILAATGGNGKEEIVAAIWVSSSFCNDWDGEVEAFLDCNDWDGDDETFLDCNDWDGDDETFLDCNDWGGDDETFLDCNERDGDDETFFCSIDWDEVESFLCNECDDER